MYISMMTKQYSCNFMGITQILCGNHAIAVGRSYDHPKGLRLLCFLSSSKIVLLTQGHCTVSNAAHTMPARTCLWATVLTVFKNLSKCRVLQNHRGYGDLRKPLVGLPSPSNIFLLAFLSTFWHPCLMCTFMCNNTREGGCQV